jgi:hypothetical protein
MGGSLFLAGFYGSCLSGLAAIVLVAPFALWKAIADERNRDMWRIRGASTRYLEDQQSQQPGWSPPGLGAEEGPLHFYVNWDKLPLGHLRRSCESIGWFLLYLGKRLLGLPIGYSPCHVGAHDVGIAVGRDQLAPQLLEEVERFSRAVPHEGFAPAGYCCFQTSQGVALLSADGLVGVMIDWASAFPETFGCTCISLLAGERRLVTYQDTGVLQSPPNWELFVVPGAQPEATVRSHRRRAKARPVIDIGAEEVTGVVASLNHELIEHNIRVGLLFPVCSDECCAGQSPQDKRTTKFL